MAERKNKAQLTTLRGAHCWREIGWEQTVGIAVIIYCVIPLLYVLSVSFVPNAVLTAPLSLSNGISFDNFKALGSDQYSMYWQWIFNSLVVSTVTAIGTVLMGAAAAYAFSRFRFRGRRGTLTFLLLVQMFPQMLAFVALFLLLLGIKDIFPVLGLNSKLGLICVYLGGALGSNTFLLFGFFNSVPRELDEAAEIDGASHAQTFWTIIMPLVLPVLAVVGLLSFIPASATSSLPRLLCKPPISTLWRSVCTTGLPMNEMLRGVSSRLVRSSLQFR